MERDAQIPVKYSFLTGVRRTKGKHSISTEKVSNCCSICCWTISTGKMASGSKIF